MNKKQKAELTKIVNDLAKIVKNAVRHEHINIEFGNGNTLNYSGPVNFIDDDTMDGGVIIDENKIAINLNNNKYRYFFNEDTFTSYIMEYFEDEWESTRDQIQILEDNYYDALSDDANDYMSFDALFSMLQKGKSAEDILKELFHEEPSNALLEVRKRPVKVKAFYWGGDYEKLIKCIPEAHRWTSNSDSLFIPTLEGKMKCEIGDWVICGVKGEYYPCKNSIFEMTYEKV